MHSVIINGCRMNYDVIYSVRRKTASLRIVSEDRLEITVPSRFEKKSIEELLQSKAAWILTQRARIGRLAANPVNSNLADGSQILFQGQLFTLRFKPGGHEVRLENAERQYKIPIQDKSRNAADTIKSWLVRKSGELLAQKTAWWAPKIGVKPNRINIKDQKTRWGSCSPATGSVNYNWRVVMAPLEVADYLVVHELVHFNISNHSSAFWQQVGAFIPDYKKCRNWLRENGALLARLF